MSEKPKILVVDDEVIVARDLSSRLTESGFTVVDLATTGKEALAKAKEHKPDLVLMDIKLKDEMDGITTAEILKNEEGIPVVFLTAFADMNTFDRAKLSEPYGFLYKPYEIKDLYATIHTALHRIKLEKQIKDNENWLSTVLTSIGDAVITTDIKGFITFMNPVAADLIQCDRDEAINQPLSKIFNIISEKTGDKVSSPVDKVLKENKIVGLANSTLLINQAGQKIPIDDSAAPIINNDGDTDGVVLVFREVSQRKNFEKEILEKEERYRTLFNSGHDIVFVFALDEKGIPTKIIEINDAACNRLGFNKDELIGIHPSKLFDESISTAINERFLQLLLQKQLLFEAVLNTHSGKTIDVEINAHIISIDGENAGLFVARDMAERKMMEAEILKAQKIESIGVLAGGIAHDFNNRLSVILGNAQLALMLADDQSKITKYLKNIEQGAEQAATLTQQLLTFSRGGDPVKKSCNLSQLITDTAKLSMSGLNERCVFEIADDLWPTEIDRGQITQVINNILLNADQAMPDGGIINIKAQNIFYKDIEPHLSLNAGNYVEISIKDHGIGIPGDIINKIFDPYFSTKQKGSGMGLAVAYSIVEKHQGIITVHSELEKGSIFTIYLPAKTDEKITMTPKIDDQKDGAEMKVLVMDDEELLLQMIGDMLEGLGYKVGLAEDGAEAVEMYKKALDENEPYSVVIMDLTIPAGMGGKEAIEKLQELDPGVKAVVSSGYSNDPIMSDYEQYGFCGVIAKPYKIVELNDLLSKLLN